MTRGQPATTTQVQLHIGTYEQFTPGRLRRLDLHRYWPAHGFVT